MTLREVSDNLINSKEFVDKLQLSTAMYFFINLFNKKQNDPIANNH